MIADKLTTVTENQQKVYDAGRKAEYDAFWDNFQGNGERICYRQAFMDFGFSWNDENYNPKYPLKLKFANYGGNSIYQNASKITDTKVAIICIDGVVLQNSFYNCASLKTIKRLVTNKEVTYTQTFTNCYNLENITIEGVVGTNINLQWSTLLSYESIVNILNALSSDVIDQTLTLSLTAVNNAFETSEGLADGSTSEKWSNLVATKTNWSIVLV